jgi:MFS family permease
VERYRRTLALPGVRTLMILMLFARIPATATAMALTLHVALGMGRGYGAAGLVGAAAMIGIGIGAPLTGRIVDRYGLRTTLVITTLGTLFWAAAPYMSYPVLLVMAFIGGLFALQPMSIGRQAIAALVPEEHQRTAYSIDSISVELAFMVGPVAAVALATQLSTSIALQAVAAGFALVGIALFVMNPAMRGVREPASAQRPPRREWLNGKLFAVLLIGSGAVFVLAGTEVAVVAVLRAHGEVDWAGAVIVILCIASIIGGLVHGAVHKSLPQVMLMALLGALTIPAMFVDSTWWIVGLVLAPASAMCAPTIASTGEAVSRLVPVAVRGEATGLQSTALTFGAALGSPVIGFIVDHSSPGWGFVGAGAGGLIVAAGAALLIRRSPAPVQLTSASAIS